VPLEDMLERVERELAALGDALKRRDVTGIEGHADDLRRALELAVDGFSLAARTGTIPALLRRRLVQASGQVAAQRESLLRATVALDRAIDVLMPRDASGTPALYGQRGALGPGGLGGPGGPGPLGPSGLAKPLASAYRN
jgi:hypothetical protein